MYGRKVHLEHTDESVKAHLQKEENKSQVEKYLLQSVALQEKCDGRMDDQNVQLVAPASSMRQTDASQSHFPAALQQPKIYRSTTLLSKLEKHMNPGITTPPKG